MSKINVEYNVINKSTFGVSIMSSAKRAWFAVGVSDPRRRRDLS